MPRSLLQPGPRSSAYYRRRGARRRLILAAALALLVGAGAFSAFTLVRAKGHPGAVVSGPPEAARAAAATPAPDATGSASAIATAAPSATETADAARDEPATLTVAAVGDMIFDRKVKSLIRAQGGSAPLAKMAETLSRADVTVGNLESPLSSDGTKEADKDVTFRGDPRGVDGLADAGFDFVSLANNHVLDYGPEALEDTVSLLDGADIGHAGAGSDESAAWEPATVERRGAKVAFLSFSHILPAGFIATDSRPGLARGRGNMDAVAGAIEEAAQTHDYVLVSFHWGVEYTDHATADQVKDAHRAIDAGADMVLSHHPHVIQGVEFYEDGLIAYSTGDFVFDHYSRKTGEAFVLEAQLGTHGVSDVTATPVYLDGYGRPAVVEGAHARSILQRLESISSRHGTSVRIAGGRAELEP